MSINMVQVETMSRPTYKRPVTYRKATANRNEQILAQLKTGVWIYFFLLIFEGALRKWVLPSLAGPLVIIRDPVVIWIIFTAWKNGFINRNLHVAMMVTIGLIGLYTAFFLGHKNLYVALYGARILIFHFPLIFVIANIFDKEDVLKIGRATLMISIPMTLLIMLQFYSPQTAWINKTVGGEAGGGFSGAMDFYRPPGTFSFTNGNTLFFGFCSGFIIYFWFNLHEIKRIVLILATIGLLIAIPFSISRGLFFQVVIALLFAFCSILLKPKYAVHMILLVGMVIGIFILLSYTKYFSTATAAFTSRFDSANKQEGGINGVLLDRFLGGMIGAIAASSKQPFFGYGIGLGTNVGSMLMNGGRGFIISEGEWGRLIGELGPVLGLTAILIRLNLAIGMLFKSFKNLLTGNLLPWMIASFGFLAVAQHGWAQPTSLGFSVLTGGLILAALKEKKAVKPVDLVEKHPVVNKRSR
jgi:hypothetical protein